MSTLYGLAPSTKSVLALKVRNHPGVMLHVCGLFARRAYNVEGILCMPMEDPTYSRIWLLVDEDERLEQIMLKTRRLVDVLDIERQAVDRSVFAQLEEAFTADV